MAWLLAFLFTQAIEIPIYMRGLRVRVYEALGASAFTHPIVWFVIPPLCDWLYFTLMAWIERFATARLDHYFERSGENVSDVQAGHRATSDGSGVTRGRRHATRRGAGLSRPPTRVFWERRTAT